MDLASLIHEAFVARDDVWARQDLGGGYMPRWEPLTTDLISTHLAHGASVGHYLSNPEGITKVIGLDIDLEPEGVWMQYPQPEEYPENLPVDQLDAWMADKVVAHPSRPRYDWRNRAHPGRAWYKQLLRTTGEYLATAMEDELGIPTLIAYSGHKGIHVYGFTNGVHVADAKAGAELALMASGRYFGAEFAPHRGKNFFKLAGGAPWAQSFAVETFPKQDSMEGKKLGNLMRLPLGVNLKSPQDPTFFVDRSTSYLNLTPHPDPVALLTETLSRRNT